MSPFIPEAIKSIKSKQDFLVFLEALESDATHNKQEWTNLSSQDYLESIRAWVNDYSFSSEDELSWDVPSWPLIALIFYSGKIYE